jgi:hypothetical protein
MFDKSSGTRVAQIAMLALLIASGLATAARADDEYGTGHETLIRQAAVSPGATLAMVASTAPIAGGQPDVVGVGGR